MGMRTTGVSRCWYQSRRSRPYCFISVNKRLQSHHNCQASLFAVLAWSAQVIRPFRIYTFGRDKYLSNGECSHLAGMQLEDSTASSTATLQGTEPAESLKTRTHLNETVSKDQLLA